MARRQEDALDVIRYITYHIRQQAGRMRLDEHISGVPKACHRNVDERKRIMIAPADRPTCLSADILPSDYHAMRALSASGAWILAEDCPAKFLWRSPWNPLWEGEDKSEFDLGTAAHL